MKKGFTLIELMLTLILIGTILISVMGIFTLDIKNTDYLSHKRQAVDLASSYLELELYDQTLLPLDPGKFTMDTEIEEPLPGTSKTVTVNVSWSDASSTINTVALSRTYYKKVDE